MDLWTTHSNPAKQGTLSMASAVVGLTLAIAFRHHSDSNAMAGLLLGLLLLSIGVAGFLTTGKQTVIIDPRTCRITVEDQNLFGKKQRSIQFSNIVSIGIGYLGKKSNFVDWYYIVLELRSGEKYSLFPPGRFYEGGSDRPTVESWKRRLEEYLKP